MATRSMIWQATRRGHRRCLLVVALVGGSLSLSACSQQLTTPCAVVVDGSGSGQRFDAKTRLDDRLPRFLRTHECGVLTFVPLTSSSEADTCTRVDLELDPDLPGDRERIREGRRTKARADAQAVLECARQKNPRSDVLGALSRAVTQRPEGAGTYPILVVSDMLQHDVGVDLENDDLSSPAKRRAILSRLADDGRIPNMKGMSLEVTDRGRGIREQDPVRYSQITSFWNELFASRAAGAPEVEYD
jgi:hypothetical protein